MSRERKEGIRQGRVLEESQKRMYGLKTKFKKKRKEENNFCRFSLTTSLRRKYRYQSSSGAHCGVSWLNIGIREVQVHTVGFRG
jgi:hypothetical protein